MTAMLTRWGLLPVGALVGALIGLMLLAALDVTRRNEDSVSVSGDTMSGDVLSGTEAISWQRAPVREGALLVRVPVGWRVERSEGELTIWPGTGGVELLERGAVVVISTGRVRPLAQEVTWYGDLLDTVGEVRRAEHVAVGGMSGVERVYIFDTDQHRPRATNNLAELMAAVGGDRLTLAIWQSPEEAPHHRVTLLDARDGSFLPLLQAIRATIEWVE